jgi:heme-degrading monooxygenase HmoA
MFARVNTFTGNLERIDEGIAWFREKSVPAIEKEPGFEGHLFLADREHETVYTMTFWKSAEEMAATKDLATELARGAAKEFGLKVETSNCEVAYSKLPAFVG